MACGGENIQVTDINDCAPQVTRGDKDFNVETRCAKPGCPHRTNKCTVRATDRNFAAVAGTMDHVAECSWQPPEDPNQPSSNLTVE